VALGAASPVRLEETHGEGWFAGEGGIVVEAYCSVCRQPYPTYSVSSHMRCPDCRQAALPVPATGPQRAINIAREQELLPVPATGPSLRALLDQWRSDASECYEDEASNAFRQCADQLEAALAAGSAPSVIQKQIKITKTILRAWTASDYATDWIARQEPLILILSGV
jgi:hypothetical protein